MKQNSKKVANPNSQNTASDEAQKKRKKSITVIQKFLVKNAHAIQKLATLEHTKLIGGDPVPAKKFAKYAKAHAGVIKAIAAHLDDYKNGIVVFSKLGEHLADDAINDDLSIEEAVDGTIFQKQAIWKKLEAGGILEDMPSTDLYWLSQTIGRYCDVLASKTAFTYHNHFLETITKSEARFRSLIEKSSDAVALVSTKGKVVYASPSTQSVTGYTPEEFKKLHNPFQLVPPNERELVTKLFEKLLKEPGTTEHAIYRVLHKNRHHIWIESSMTNLLRETSVGAVVINYHDISDRKLLENQKDDFISIAAHELKTPVTSIKSYAQLLKARFDREGNKSAVMMLSKMDVQITKLANLIGDLLDVSKVDGGKLQFRNEKFDFKELVEEIVEEMQLTTTVHNIVRKLTHPQVIQGDRDRIGQVITNLLSNAIRYSPHNNKIIVRTKTKDNNVTLCVEDYGIGIHKHKQAMVFDRFFRAGDTEDTYEGLGLGLFISHEIVHRHGGRIWLKSVKGKGSTFCFTLPIKISPNSNYF